MGNELVEKEKKIQEKWEKNRVFTFDPEAKESIYSVDTPPPTVSGRMHLGHAFSYSHTDFIARFKRMKGFNVFYPFGLDDNGLATERLVEKSRKIKARDFTREEFIKICLEETKKHEEQMMSDFKSLGLSIDWELTYRTIDSKSRKISQRSFIDIYKKGRAYRKEAPSMWCPACETAIAQAELEDVEKDSTFNDIVFKLENKEELIIATTRPELLSSCVAVFIHPSNKRKKELLGKKAQVPLFNHWVPILEDERVDPEKGSGIVMCCTFGDQTDMEWYFIHNLPLKISFTKDGKMTEIAGKYEGMKIIEARKEIISDMKEAGLLKKQIPIKHAVKVHERCKTEIEIMHTKQWFIKYLDLKEEFIKKGNELKWYPKHMKVRYDNWINGLQWDWSISRQRFFGVPFPVWYCKGCGETIVAEEKELPVDPLESKPKGKCSKCGKTDFEAEKDVFDTWMTSSLTPQINAKWGEDEKLYKKIFPMSMRPQAHDIITLWAFNTIVKAYFHEKKLPWKEIVISGHALDPKGRKMSKSLGNAVNPVEMIEKYSADILRYWASMATLGEDLPLQEKEFVSGKKFITKLKNACNFVAMKTEGISLEEFEKEKKNLKEIDKWILSRFEKVKKEATDSFEKYEFSKAMSALRNFFWLEFADFYLEEIKHRVYNEDESGKAAKAVLLKITTELLKMLAPFLPHATEEIFSEKFTSIAKEKSIHIEKWPENDSKLLNEEAEKAGEMAKEIISEIRKLKSTKNLAMNAELEKIKVTVPDEKAFNAVADDIKETMKIKEIEVEKAESGIKVELSQ